MYENAYIEQDYARKILLINQVIDPFAPISFISLINEANTLMTYATPQVSETTQQVQISDSYIQNCYSRLTHCVSPYWPIITLLFSWITILSRIQPITFFFFFFFSSWRSKLAFSVHQRQFDRLFRVNILIQHRPVMQMSIHGNISVQKWPQVCT